MFSSIFAVFFIMNLSGIINIKIEKDKNSKRKGNNIKTI